jgi:cytochrome bd-type quinol oxidase subunit 1
MGLALLTVVLKTMALRTNDERYNIAARFWAQIFSVNLLLGVVTGIPMEFQFGTNWSEFSRRTGGVIGQPLAMEGVFSFFLTEVTHDIGSSGYFGPSEGDKSFCLNGGISKYRCSADLPS